MNRQSIPFPAAIAGIAAGTLPALAQSEPQAKRVEDLIRGISSTNETVSSAACESAPDYGPTAVRALAFAMGGQDFEVARKARRALHALVRHAGRPGATAEATALQSRLVGALQSRRPFPTAVRRELVWLLSEIGTASAVLPVVELLADKELRDDARCVLTRMPFPEALEALKRALNSAEESFRYALADSLRARGEKIEAYPSRKMVPTAQTTVVPLPVKKSS